MSTRASKQAKSGPEIWDLDGDGRRFALVVNGRIMFCGSHEECARRLQILTAESDKGKRDYMLQRAVR